MIYWEACKEMQKNNNGDPFHHEDVVKYLEAHESDIAWEINDFGELRLAFIALVGRKPEK